MSFKGVVARATPPEVEATLLVTSFDRVQGCFTVPSSRAAH